MAPVHTPWIMEPVKLGLQVPGTDPRRMRSSARVLHAREKQMASRPRPGTAGARPAAERARDLAISPIVGAVPFASTTRPVRELLNTAGRHAQPRQHEHGDANVGHGFRRTPVAASQPHVSTLEWRVADERATPVRRAETPTTNRARAELLLTGHRSATTSRRRPGSAPPKQATSQLGYVAPPMICDLSYRSVCPDGEHWRTVERPTEPFQKTFFMLPEPNKNRVYLEDLEPGLAGAPPEEVAKRATVYQPAEPGVITFMRDWHGTFGRHQRCARAARAPRHSETLVRTAHSFAPSRARARRTAWRRACSSRRWSASASCIRASRRCSTGGSPSRWPRPRGGGPTNAHSRPRPRCAHPGLGRPC